jgi:phosphatidylethanolamine-binding protein (PEBP) family uncharacterized protein
MMKVAILTLFLILFAGCAAGNSNDSGSGAFTLTSSAFTDGGSMPALYTCDGTSISPPLSWAGAPASTTEYALLMTTLPGDGTTKWNWVLYNIPSTTTSLSEGATNAGTFGVTSDGPDLAYSGPCSQGPGSKDYTFTLYALSSAPIFSVAAALVSGDVLGTAISAITVDTASLTVGYTRE